MSGLYRLCIRVAVVVSIGGIVAGLFGRPALGWVAFAIAAPTTGAALWLDYREHYG